MLTGRNVPCSLRDVGEAAPNNGLQTNRCATLGTLRGHLFDAAAAEGSRVTLIPHSGAGGSSQAEWSLGDDPGNREAQVTVSC
jgi:hypothetical protein